MSEKRDYYEVLGIDRNAPAADIKKAYRKLALKNHPDQNSGDPEAEVRFKEAAEAYQILSDPEKRAQYDRFGHRAFAGAGMAGGPGFGSIEDIFEAFGDIFGGGGGGGIFGDLFGGGRRRSRGPRRGRDLRIVLDLSLEEIDQGVRRTIELRRQETCSQCDGRGTAPGSSRSTCPVCGGQGQIHRRQGFFAVTTACARCRGEGTVIDDPCRGCNGSGRISAKAEVAIEVPAGVEEGMRIRVPAAGDAGQPGAPRGDLYCIVREREHNVFQRGGPDLITEVPFSYAQLALGDKVEIPTLRGRVEMSIPSGTQSGKVFRLRGQGLPRVDGGGRGDQLVRVFVEIPSKLTAQQKDLLREFESIESEKSGSKSFFEKIVEYFS